MPAIHCEGLEKHYPTASGNVAALRGLDLQITAGEFLAVTGPSGCGKTTLLNMLGALDRPTNGRLRVFGRDLDGLTARERALYRRTDVGFVFQQFHLIPTLTAEENVSLPLRYGGVPRGERKARARVLLDRVGLAARGDHFPALLSGGERQRVAMARALVGGARLLLADEPTGNLDGETAGQIVGLLADAVAEGITVVLVTHDPEVAALASRRLRLRDGAVEADERS
jgi:putative ABC transport system ATP-binding protein